MTMTFEPMKPWHKTTIDITEVMDRTWKEKKDGEPRRQYLGASIVGGPCERQIAYQWHNTPKDDDGFSGRLYRIFDRGHKGEDRMAEYLRTAGFELVTHRADGSQFGFSALGGKFSGHIDGIIHGGPLNITYPCLWENKVLNHKSWNDLFNHGLQKSKPVYFTQANLYMAYMELESCLFTAENADTCEVYAEVVPLDVAHAQAMSDRAVRVIASTLPTDLARCTCDKSDFRCKLCSWSKTCWQENQAPATTTQRPPWLG